MLYLQSKGINYPMDNQPQTQRPQDNPPAPTDLTTSVPPPASVAPQSPPTPAVTSPAMPADSAAPIIPAAPAAPEPALADSMPAPDPTPAAPALVSDPVVQPPAAETQPLPPVAPAPDPAPVVATPDITEAVSPVVPGEATQVATVESSLNTPSPLPTPPAETSVEPEANTPVPPATESTAKPEPLPLPPPPTPARHAPAAAAATAMATGRHHRHRRRRPWVALIIIVVLIAAAVGGLFFYSSKQGELEPAVITPKREAIHKPVKFYCSFTARALLCQDIGDGKATKYRLPDSFGNVVTVLPSPDSKKLLIQTAANPANQSDTGRILITDTAFKVGQELPKDPAMAYSSIAWADDNTVAVARRTIATGKTTVGVYDIATKKTEDLALSTNGYFILQSSATGDFVFVEDHLNDKPALKAIQVSGRKVVDIDSSDALSKITTYGTMGYDHVSDLFYLTGTTKANQPQTVIAKLEGTDTLKLAPQKSIEDGYSYVPLAAADGGMLVSRQKKDSKDPKEAALSYGLMDADGKFSDKQVKPSAEAAFGLVDLPTAKAAASATLEAGDFLGGVINSPPALQTLVGKLVTNPACPAGTYNAATLLAHDETQAAVSVSACNNQPAVLQYYGLQNGSYVQLGVSSNIPPLCNQTESLKLSKAVAPTCKNDH